MNENIILLFYYIYFKLVLEFMWYIQKKKSVIFNFLSRNFLSCKTGYRLSQ